MITQPLGIVVGTLYEKPGGMVSPSVSLMRALRNPCDRGRVSGAQIITSGSRSPNLLEIFLAADVLEVWSEWRSGRAPTASEAIAAIEWYGDHDAYQPVDA